MAAKNSVGTGPQSAESNAVAPVAVPDAPTNVSASAGSSRATVSWTAPTSNGGTAITSYVVTPFVNGVAQASTTVGNVTSATITGLTNGTSYTFEVAAEMDVGTPAVGRVECGHSQGSGVGGAQWRCGAPR